MMSIELEETEKYKMEMREKYQQFFSYLLLKYGDQSKIYLMSTTSNRFFIREDIPRIEEIIGNYTMEDVIKDFEDSGIYKIDRRKSKNFNRHWEGPYVYTYLFSRTRYDDRLIRIDSSPINLEF